MRYTTTPPIGWRPGIFLCAFLLIRVEGYSIDKKNQPEYMQGLHWMGQGQYDRAVVVFKNMIGRDEHNARACIKICESYKGKQTLDEGLLYFEALARKNPENPYFHHGLGLIHHEMKNHAKALEQFRLTMKLAPSYARPYKDFIDVMGQLNRIEEASKNLKTRLRNDSKNAALYYGMGHLYLAQNRLDEALKNADKAVKWDGNFLDACHLKGLILSGMGRFSELFEISQTGLKKAEGEDDVEFQCLFLTLMGYAKYFLSDYPACLEYCRKALQLAGEIADKPDEILALQYMGNAYRDTGKPNEALACFNRALVLSRQIGDRRSEGSSERLIGTAYTFLCEFLEARKYFQKALPIAAETGNDNLKALALCGLGSVSWSLGDYAVALNQMNEALGISEKRNYPVVIQMCLGTMGLVHWNLGHFSEALECNERALAIARKHGLKLWESVHLGNIAVIFTDTGDYSTALTYYEQAMRIAVETGSRTLEGMHLNNMAGIYSERLHQHERAMDCYRKALLLATETGDKRLEADFLGNIGYILRITGKKAEAEPAIQKALSISQRISHKGGEAWQLMNLGGLYNDEGDLDKAMSFYGNSLAIGKRLSSPKIILKSYLGIGTVYEKRGNDARALAQYRKAIDEIEVIRDRLSTEELKTFFMETEFSAYEKIIHLLRLMHRASPGHGYDGESFRYAERAKARSFLEFINQANVFQNLEKVPRDLREEVVSNNNLLSKEYQSLSEEMNRASAEQDPVRISRIEQNIKLLQRTKARLLDRLRHNNPEYYDLTHPRLISAEAVRNEHLGGNRVLVEYFVGDEDTYVWVLTPKRMVFQSIGMGRGSLEKKLAQVSPLFLRDKKEPSGAMDHRWANVNSDLLHRLYRTLLEIPVGGDLTEGRDLLIISDDLLNYFPFEILVTDIDKKQIHYLIESHPVSYASSASLLGRDLMRRKNADKNLLAFGNPYVRQARNRNLWWNPGTWFKTANVVLRNNEFESLPNAEKEVNAIAKNFVNPSVFIGKEATEQRFKQSAGDYRFIHLATHYLTSDMQPMFSKVVLSRTNNDREDGYLQMYEVYNLNLKADMAILSGCNTGLGRLHRGEGLIGMSRAFFYAGAYNLVVSLWPVEDESTSHLMMSFYGYIGKGMKKSHALQQAKIDMIRSADSRRDPFYWGPFVLIGDSKL